MSPGNSYFKDEIVERLLRKVVDEFGKTAVLVADIPAISTYVALGYPENRARRDKALPQGNGLRNKVTKAMSVLGLSAEQVKVINWSAEIENNLDYKEKLDKVRRLFDSNSLFHEAANNATKEVLEYSGKLNSDTDSAVKIAVHYLLSELAFLEFAPKYLGVSRVTYIYHKDWPVYSSYIKGEFDGVTRPHLNFSIIKV